VGDYKIVDEQAEKNLKAVGLAVGIICVYVARCAKAVGITRLYPPYACH